MANLASSIALTFLLIFHSLQAAQAGAMAGLGGGGMRRSPAGYVPVPTVVFRSVALPIPDATTASAVDEAPAGGGYQPFELCMGCRCCTSAAAPAAVNNKASSCVDTRCCYAINCDIPGKPYGVCAFSPLTCGCGASNCTTQT